MKQAKGPRTPLGKARKRIKELEGQLAAANAALDATHNDRINTRAKLAQDAEHARQYATMDSMKVGPDDRITPRDMAHALINELKPNRAGLFVAIAHLRATLKYQILADEAHARYRQGRR